MIILPEYSRWQGEVGILTRPISDNLIDLVGVARGELSDVINREWVFRGGNSEMGIPIHARDKYQNLVD